MYLVFIQFIFVCACSFDDETFRIELHLHENWIKFSFTSIIVNSIFVRSSLPSKLLLNMFKNVPDIAAWVRFLVSGNEFLQFRLITRCLLKSELYSTGVFLFAK